MSFVGVDVGGTKVAAARLEDHGRLGEPAVHPTDVSSPEKLLDQLVAAVEEVRADDVEAVGIAVPSVVDFAAGRVRYSVNIPLADIALRDVLSDRLGLPVFVDNDGSVAALAEATVDGEIVVRNLVIFTVGTGVGGGIVSGGRLFRGATGAAAEFGHIMIGASLEDGAPDASEKFPQRGSLEANAAGRVLDRLALEAARADPSSELGRRLERDGEVTGVDVVEAARQGDKNASRAMCILGERLGIGIANLINVFDPDEVVIGGGVSAAGDLLLEPARDVARRYTLPGVGTKTEIRLARHGSAAGVLGAALMAREALHEEESHR